MEPIRAINHDEVLRYLGYRGQPLSEDLIQEVCACETQMLAYAKPAYLFRVFPSEKIPEGIRLVGTTLVLPGADILSHLAGCSQIAVLAATLSVEADRLIASARIDSMTKYLALDAAADALVEQVCDMAERELRAQMSEMHATWRFSPGYGDFPITLQNQILTVLDAQKRIGLCATDSHLLTPRKSVTAVIGFSETELPKKQRGCETCVMRETCAYRKRGECCVW